MRRIRLRERLDGRIYLTDTGDFTAGDYDLLFEATNFVTLEDGVIVFPDTTITRDAALDPVGPVVVNIVFDGDAEPGATVVAMAEVVILDGSTLMGYAWSQVGGTFGGRSSGAIGGSLSTCISSAL